MSTGVDLDAAGLLERYTLKGFVEACLILEDGVASAKDIDFGMVAGANGAPPLASADQAGLDAVVSRLERAADEWGEAFVPPTILRRLVAQGRLGVKAGQGFFPYARPDAGWEERPVKLESRGDVAIAWLDRPPANSLAPEVLDTMAELWEHVTGSREIRVLVFASANPMLFCAGADIKAFQRLDATTCRDLADSAHGLFGAFATSPVVTIA
ncbi:MAG: 3-hydroxyacyl-CoA dehydrogenase family protein, partial [Solirubrobacteraceae bacterium]